MKPFNDLGVEEERFQAYERNCSQFPEDTF